MNEDKVLKEMNRLCRKLTSFSHIMGDEEAARIIAAAPFETIANIEEMIGDTESFEALKSDAEDRLRAKEAKKAQMKITKWAQRAANRSQYVPTTVFVGKTTVDGRLRIQSDVKVRCGGLLEAMVEDIHGKQTSPVGVYYYTIKDAESTDGLVGLETEGDYFKREQYEKQMKALPEVFRSENLILSKGRLLWNRSSPGWDYLMRAFNKQIELGAYGHSLMTPLVPYGFVRDCRVIFRILKNPEGVHIGTDGSGIYHPNAPELAQVIAEYGPVPMQIRYLHPEGYFAKGMMFPSEDAVDSEGNPAVVFDLAQVKGNMKPWAKDLIAKDEEATVTGGYLGVFRYWLRPGLMNSCFEVLENIQVNSETKSIVMTLVENAIKRLISQGPAGMIRQVARQDETIKAMVQIITATNQATGGNISPLSIPRIREAVNETLRKSLYRIAQGGGMKFRNFVVRMDNTLQEGTCVIPGIAYGTEIAAVRMPLVLAQGLRTLKVVKPRHYQAWEGKPVEATIVMNPRDVVTMMQGDDDGDTVGISADHNVVELFKHRIDSNVYLIEPEGIKNEEVIGTVDSLESLARDQMGAVGLCCFLRSQLLAVGDVAGANAMSISMQENVDAAKNKIHYSNFAKAANLSNWIKSPRGEYRFNIRLDTERFEIGEFPIQSAFKWVEQRLIKAGCSYTDKNGTLKGGNPLGWRHKNKKIEPETWQSTKTNSHYHGGNMVHISYDWARTIFISEAGSFFGDEPEIDSRDLLRKALNAHGITIKKESWTELETKMLVSKSGLREYLRDVHNMMLLKDDDDDQVIGVMNNGINRAQETFETKLEKLSLEDMVGIWESAHDEGKPLNAFRVTCWKGSPVLKAMGIEETERCEFLNSKRLDFLISKAMESEVPHQKISELMGGVKLHQVENTDEEKNPVFIWNCPDCMDKVQNELVRQIRRQKTSKLISWGPEMVDRVNKVLKAKYYENLGE